MFKLENSVISNDQYSERNPPHKEIMNEINQNVLPEDNGTVKVP